jgi:hypothetical protein
MITPTTSFDFTSGLLNPIIDLTRALNTATRVNSSGLIEVINANLPRFDYDPSTLLCKGLLIEETRQNRLTYSQNFAQSIWAVAGTATKVASASVCPDGTTSAYTITVGTGSNFFWYNSLNITAATRYEPSIYIKRATTSGTLRINSANGTSNGQWTINLALLGSGFERITRTHPAVTVVTEFTGTGNNFSGIVFVSASGTLQFEVWGAQIELGTSSTSYIPTTTAALTRNADVATITGANFSSFWQAVKGGASVLATPSTVSGIRPLVQFDDGTANEIIALRGNTTNPELYIVDGGTPQAQLDAGTIAVNTAYSLTGWWDTNDCKARQNSNAAVSDYTATIPTVTQMRIGSDGTNYLNGILATISYYDTFFGQPIYTRRKNKVFQSLI